MKKILLITMLATIGISLKALAQENIMIQKLPLLNPYEYNLIEDKLPASIRREASTRDSGQFNVIILSGTNKISIQNTARWLAQKVNMAIYRVDLSLVVSKNILETENNFNTVFETAKNNNGVLYLEEAEALFGSRTPVKNGHDRYNQETIYFLRQVEKYRGSIIISLTAQNNINPAVFEKFVRISIH